MSEVFIAGGTGYIGRVLIGRLCARNLPVKAVVRPQSIAKVPPNCRPIPADVLDAATYQGSIAPGSTFVHLVGVPHPAPWKHKAFRSIDLVSLEQSVRAARHAGVSHFIYMSVAHPAPVMKAYVQVRVECEQIIRDSTMPATILRPWYVLGPGHRWPVILLPAYKLCESISATRPAAIRLGLVTREQIVAALETAILQGPRGFRILETAAIRQAPIPSTSP